MLAFSQLLGAFIKKNELLKSDSTCLTTINFGDIKLIIVHNQDNQNYINIFIKTINDTKTNQSQKIELLKKLTEKEGLVIAIFENNSLKEISSNNNDSFKIWTGIFDKNLKLLNGLFTKKCGSLSSISNFSHGKLVKIELSVSTAGEKITLEGELNKSDEEYILRNGTIESERTATENKTIITIRDGRVISIKCKQNSIYYSVDFDTTQCACGINSDNNACEEANLQFAPLKTILDNLIQQDQIFSIKTIGKINDLIEKIAKEVIRQINTQELQFEKLPQDIADRRKLEKLLQNIGINLPAQSKKSPTRTSTPSPHNPAEVRENDQDELFDANEAVIIWHGLQKTLKESKQEQGRSRTFKPKFPPELQKVASNLLEKVLPGSEKLATDLEEKSIPNEHPSSSSESSSPITNLPKRANLCEMLQTHFLTSVLHAISCVLNEGLHGFLISTEKTNRSYALLNALKHFTDRNTLFQDLKLDETKIETLNKKLSQKTADHDSEMIKLVLEQCAHLALKSQYDKNSSQQKATMIMKEEGVRLGG